MCPRCPGHSKKGSPQVAQGVPASMGPSEGSYRPPASGRPPSSSACAPVTALADSARSSSSPYCAQPARRTPHTSRRCAMAPRACQRRYAAAAAAAAAAGTDADARAAAGAGAAAGVSRPAPSRRKSRQHHWLTGNPGADARTTAHALGQIWCSRSGGRGVTAGVAARARSSPRSARRQKSCTTTNRPLPEPSISSALVFRLLPCRLRQGAARRTRRRRRRRRRL